MRKLLYVLGTLTLAAIGALGIGVVVLVYTGNALDAESKAFVDTAVPAISARWSEQELLDRATPELRKSVKPGELAALFNTFSRLGSLVAYEGATGEATMSYMDGSGGVVSAAYVATAKFQNGRGSFRIGLIKRDGQWLIHNFHVDRAPGSPAGAGA
jgi:hypothetical protein